MSFGDLNRRHLSLIGLYSTRYAIRGAAGLIFLVLVMAVGLIMAHVALLPVDQIRYEMRRQGQEHQTQEVMDRMIREAVPKLSWLLGERESPIMDQDTQEITDTWGSYLLEEKPAPLSIVLLLLVMLMPSMTVLAGFNQYSGDVGSRGIRYQLLRTERANIYFGRYLGALLYATVTIGVLLGTIVTYMGLTLDFYAWSQLIGWGLRGWFGLTLLLVPYLALCGWISGAVDSPIGALVLCLLVVAGVPLAALIGGLWWEHAKYVKWALPWGIQNDLLHYAGARVSLAALACLGYGAVFLTLGYRHFATRDL